MPARNCELINISAVIFVSIKSNLVRLLGQPKQFYLWLGPAWLILGLSRLAIVTLSFRRIAGWLGVHEGTAAQVPLATGQQEAISAAVGRAIRVAARLTPWQSNCFPQAITARLILAVHRLPHAVYFGVRKGASKDELLAHAWVACGRSNVTGGHSFGKYTTVGCFVSL